MDSTNVKIGVCSVEFDGVELGHTKGGVTVTYTPDIHDVTVDQYGSTPIEKIMVGQKLTATVPLAEATLQNLSVAIPTATADDDVLTIGGTVGDRLSDVAGVLVLHPVANDTDLSEDVIFYKAVVTSTVTMPYKIDEERVIEVEFEAMLDESKSDGNQLGMIGDSTS